MLVFFSKNIDVVVGWLPFVCGILIMMVVVVVVVAIVMLVSLLAAHKMLSLELTVICNNNTYRAKN